MNDRGVLVCGAGPVGLTVALELARHGVRPRIIDRNDGPTDLSKALIVWRRTLKGLDAEVPFENFIRGHRMPSAGRLFSRGKEIACIDFEEGEPASPPALPIGVLVPQSDTERILIDALKTHGVEVERKTCLESFNAVEEGVDVTIESSTGSEEGRVGWLIGCDGGRSTVRHRLGIDFPGATSDRSWLISDIEIKDDSNPTEIRIEFSSEGTVAIFPVGEHRWRVIADLGEQTFESDPTLADVQRVLDERTATGWKATTAHWLSRFGVNERQVTQYRHGRVFLVGDAAHVHSPAGGQGMNTGIQDALNMAWKLALVMRGGAADSLLDTYQSERHPIGEHVVEGSARLLKAASVSNKLAQAARNTIVHLAMGVPAIRHRFRDALAEDDLHYRHGHLIDGSGTKRLCSGDILPNTLVEVDGELASVYSLLRGSSATVLVVGASTPHGIPERFGLDDAGLPIEVRRIGVGGDAVDSQGTTSRLLGGDGSIVLVRPDAVVATMTHSVEAISAWITDRLISEPNQQESE
jgi:2-polyprenyl-6-methoxyphenol hydroxylase-like FAD-dependent oxidoreductase